MKYVQSQIPIRSVAHVSPELGRYVRILTYIYILDKWPIALTPTNEPIRFQSNQQQKDLWDKAKNFMLAGYGCLGIRKGFPLNKRKFVVRVGDFETGNVFVFSIVSS